VPAALLVGFAFGAVGMAATSFMKTWQDFDLIQLVVLPMFLFSGTFFPISSLPAALEALAYVTPLWHGVSLCRQLTLGDVAIWKAFGHLAYLVSFAAVGLAFARYTYRKRLVL